MKKTYFLLLVIIIIALTGCAKKPTHEEMAAWDYGPYPENYQQLIKDKMTFILLDPYSAQYHFQGKPQKMYSSQPFRDIIYGWGGIVLINAKNRLGGYVGVKPFEYIIKNGQVVWLHENINATY